MVFTQRPYGHTFHVCRRGLALVESLVVQTSPASFRAVLQKPSVVRPRRGWPPIPTNHLRRIQTRTPRSVCRQPFGAPEHFSPASLWAFSQVNSWHFCTLETNGQTLTYSWVRSVSYSASWAVFSRACSVSNEFRGITFSLGSGFCR